MDVFQELHGEVCIVISRGTYKQCKLYAFRGRLFFACAGGFIRICTKLGDRWCTSHPNYLVDALPKPFADQREPKP